METKSVQFAQTIIDTLEKSVQAGQFIDSSDSVPSGDNTEATFTAIKLVENNVGISTQKSPRERNFMSPMTYGIWCLEEKRWCSGTEGTYDEMLAELPKWVSGEAQALEFPHGFHYEVRINHTCDCIDVLDDNTVNK